MAITAKDFYRSSNGDRWQLIRDIASGLEPVRLRNSSTSVSVVRPPDDRFGSCLTKVRPEAMSRISCQRSPLELL